MDQHNHLGFDRAGPPGHLLVAQRMTGIVHRDHRDIGSTHSFRNIARPVGAVVSHIQERYSSGLHAERNVGDAGQANMAARDPLRRRPASSKSCWLVLWPEYQSGTPLMETSPNQKSPGVRIIDVAPARRSTASWSKREWVTKARSQSISDNRLVNQ